MGKLYDFVRGMIVIDFPCLNAGPSLLAAPMLYCKYFVILGSVLHAEYGGMLSYMSDTKYGPSSFDVFCIFWLGLMQEQVQYWVIVGF